MTDRRRPRSSFAERAAGFLRDWSVPRQVAGAPHRTKAAESETGCVCTCMLSSNG